jgi:hypothetical protein
MQGDRASDGRRPRRVTGTPLWYRDPAALRFLAFRYLPWFAGLNLAWEVAHVRLYTLWSEAEPVYIAFSILHCTLGDVLIGIAALLLALMAGREGSLKDWHVARVAAVTAILGTGYTVFSEWMNITLLRSWIYAESMPRLAIGDFEIGISPLMQWLVVPPLALYVARNTLAHR